MNQNTSILFGRFEGFLWIRCTGKGSFANSPIVKQIADNAIDEGISLIVIDMEACTGIDSTFMGTLAGIAGRLRPIGGSVQLTTLNERCQNAIEGLGLDVLLEVEPLEAPWRGKVNLIRENLGEEPAPMVKLSDLEHSKHVLNSHITLSELNESNANKFKAVTEGLTEEIKRKESE